MIGYVSGEAARGAVLRGGGYQGFILDRANCITLQHDELPAFFMHAWDVQMVECGSDTEIRSKIEESWKCDRTLRLALIALDVAHESDFRREAASYVEDLICDPSCAEFLKYHLYARPLPSEFDPEAVSEFLSEGGTSSLEDLFDALVAHQDAIRNCVDAWGELPDEIFEDENEKEEFHARIVRTGAFYKFATASGGDNDALFRILADPAIASKPAKARKIVNLWADRYKEKPFVRPVHFEDETESGFHFPVTSGRHKSNYEVFQRVRKCKSQIRAELTAGNFERADELVEQLVEGQRKSSSPEHVAKSLCDLAMFCRQVGDVDRFLLYSHRATQEAPSDGWAYVQVGNAHIAKLEFSRAMEAFEKAYAFGEERASMLGRVEALKYLGQKELAIETLDECIRRFPNDPVAQNSSASLLAYFGRLTESLAAYDDLAQSPFAGAYVFGGRASVLADLCRFEEAIHDQDLAITFTELNDVIPYCAKADILREYGRFEEALAVLDLPPRNVNTRLQLEMARARVFRDSGNLRRSEDILASIGGDYPRDVNVKMAVAELHRKRGDFSGALTLLQDIEESFPNSRFARNSTAATLAALGRLDAAVFYLPERSPSTRGDWVGQHIRAMIYIKKGDLDGAESLLLDGLEGCPWPQQRPYFASALAFLKLRMNDAHSALHILDSVGELVTPSTEVFVSAVRVHALAACGESNAAAVDGLRSAVSNSLIQNFVRELELASLRASNDNRFGGDDLFGSEWSMLIGMVA